MKLAQLLSDWEGSQLENRWNRRFIVGLLLMVLLLVPRQLHWPVRRQLLWPLDHH